MARPNARRMLTVLPPDRHVFDGPLAGKAGSSASPSSTWTCAILRENGTEVERGEVGEICARGPSVMLGYWNQPEQTEEVSRHGWHHTGDGGYMDEGGFIFIVDRMKDMIISGGENVYSAEVENALYKHPDVAECAVIGVPDDEWGERVHAVVRLKDGAEPDEASLSEHCQHPHRRLQAPPILRVQDRPAAPFRRRQDPQDRAAQTLVGGGDQEGPLILSGGRRMPWCNFRCVMLLSYVPALSVGQKENEGR
jgi:acyl-CoA synthetase (AMP-forming)/AMP-acid ligase II